MSDVGEKAVNPLNSFPGCSPPIPWNTESIKNWAGRCPLCVCGITVIWVEQLDAFLWHVCPAFSEGQLVMEDGGYVAALSFVAVLMVSCGVCCSPYL